MKNLIRKIDRNLFQYCQHIPNKDIHIETSIYLTEIEKELFFKLEKYKKNEYFWYFEGNTLFISYKKLAA